MSGFDITSARVAVLMGGDSAERDISLMSGQGVLQALLSKGVQAQAFDPSTQDLSDLRGLGITHVFIALHGRHGEDGTVQGALELLGIPYTGSGVMASAIAMDKVMTKRLWRSHGLDTPASVCLSPTEQSAARIAAIPAELGLPLIVKPPREGSSIGVTKVCQASDMAAAAALATRYDPELLCEAFIDGDEITCPVLGEGADAVALPIVRIAAPQGDYDYQNKYFTDDTQYLVPSGLPLAEEKAIEALVVKAYQLLGCRGWGRLDVMIDAQTRQPYLLEINTSPGMTGHSLVPMSAKAAGISYEALCQQLLTSASLDHVQEVRA